MGYFPEEIHSFSQKESKGRVILEFGKKYFYNLSRIQLVTLAAVKSPFQFLVHRVGLPLFLKVLWKVLSCLKV